MGRNRKSSDKVTGNYTIEQQESRKASEEAINSLTPISLNPPDWLDEIAQQEYRRIVPLLKELPVASLDYSLVNSYCSAYSDLVRASKRLKEEPEIIETAHGTKLNQNHIIKREAFKIINAVAPKLGMTIDSRLKIFTPKKEDKKKDEFEEFIND